MLIGCVSSFSKKKKNWASFFQSTAWCKTATIFINVGFFFFFFFGVKVYQCDLKIK
jgi:hypothetical protein